tara:strand:+ start:22155 stop:22373 length:219 start_codon:yes stop_codon:yes gene_type:complete
MISGKLKDIYGTEIEISESRSGYFRMDFKGDSLKKKDDGLGNEIPICISLNENQARMLQCCINSYFEEVSNE